MNTKKQIIATVKCLVCLAALARPTTLQAGTHIWSGSANGLWSNAANWSSGGVPAAGEAAPVVIQFPSTAQPRRNNTNDIAGLQLDVIRFFGSGYSLQDNMGLALRDTPPPFPYLYNITCSGTNSVASIGVKLSGAVTMNAGADSELIFWGEIADAPGASGGIVKFGTGTLWMTGSAYNSYTGATEVREGELALGRCSVWLGIYSFSTSVPNNLTIGTTNPAVPAMVRLLMPGQLSDGCLLAVQASGTLDMTNAHLYNPVDPNPLRVSETIGQLSGAGDVNLGKNSLVLSGLKSAATATFNGHLSGSGEFVKNGTNHFVLYGSLDFKGTISVNCGKLLLNSYMNYAAIDVNSNASFYGTGLVGFIKGTGGTVNPGNNVGLLRAGTLNLSPAHAFRSEISAGGTFGQLVVSNLVKLGNASLNVNFNYFPAPGDKFKIIDNASGNPVIGTFAGLPEGGTFVALGHTFSVSYVGGDGNDVVISDITAGPTAHLIGISKFPGGMQIYASGTPKAMFTAWASSSLSQPAWVSLGPVTADALGQITFNDPASANFNQRYYRLSYP